MKVGLLRAYNRMVARWPNLDLIELLRHRPQQGIVAGLLVIAVLSGAVNLAMKSSSASGSKTQVTKSVVPKFQDRPPTEFAASAPFSTNPLQPTSPRDLTGAEAFSASNGHPTGGLVRVPIEASHSEAAAQTYRPTPISRSETAAGTESVPLPMKRPVRSFAGQAKPKTATSRKALQRPQEPEPMRFGIIGYNYNPRQ